MDTVLSAVALAVKLPALNVQNVERLLVITNQNDMMSKD